MHFHNLLFFLQIFIHCFSHFHQFLIYFCKTLDIFYTSRTQEPNHLDQDGPKRLQHTSILYSSGISGDESGPGGRIQERIEHPQPRGLQMEDLRCQGNIRSMQYIGTYAWIYLMVLWSFVLKEWVAERLYDPDLEWFIILYIVLCLNFFNIIFCLD